MTLQGRLQDNSLPHNSKVKIDFKFTELDINAIQAFLPKQINKEKITLVITITIVTLWATDNQ